MLSEVDVFDVLFVCRSSSAGPCLLLGFKPRSSTVLRSSSYALVL